MPRALSSLSSLCSVSVPLFALGVSLLGCGTGGGRMETFVSGMSAEDSQTATGDEQTGDGDGDSQTGDGDASTGDGDGDGPTGDGDGDGPTGDGDGDDASGDGDGDAPPELCQRYRYTYQFNNDSWDSIPLDQAWVGPNAPPCAVAPEAITFIEVWDQLLVWGDDGMFYRRVNGAWQTPEAAADRWPVIADLDIDDASNIPPVEGETTARIQFSAGPEIQVYGMYEDGSTVFLQTVMQADWPLPGPPSLTQTTLWSFSITDLDKAGMSDWWEGWAYLDDNVLYHVVGIFAWENWPVGQSPMFGGAPVMVNANTMEAAWGSHDLNRAYFVGP